ncbi:hypothetical protein RHGRI_037097 [Rhododendron griersonianum]|uniref:Cytochrome P450 n=1 Tax=Rhododendron griersonianum TaxID=479676 RepID=A0AAV6HW86_9ERIC|nr:hypothetical protein RHGRI_037097 [Rhododendron griersonianum]
METTCHRKHSPLSRFTPTSFFEKFGEEIWTPHAFATRGKFNDCHIIIATIGQRDIAYCPYGDYRRQMRKVCILELLSAKNVRSFCSIREDEVFHLMESVKSSFGLPINLTEKIFSLTNDITFRAAFGKRYEDKDAIIPLIKETVEVAGGFNLCDSFPSLKVLHLLSGMRGNGEGGEEDLLDVLLGLKHRGGLQFPMTNNNIKAIIQEIFCAGTDTSSTTIDWAMSEMVRNLRVMKKTQAEVRQVLRGKKRICEADIQELKYLKLVIKETLRLHPPAPLLLPRECREQIEMDGYLIPVKTKLIVNVWAIGRDPEYWVDAEIFSPERFNNSPVDFIGTGFQYIPFGAGRRICPGISFGLANVELPLAQLLYHFNWNQSNGTKPEDLDMTETFGASVRRISGLNLIATPYFT